jgi:hypothetical protein
MIMLLHYSVPAKLVLDPDRAPAVLAMLEKAGVGMVWLQGYFFGHFDAPMNQLVAARAILEQYNFKTGIISMPVGHPGNSLDPEDLTLDLRIPAHWRYRVDRHGNTVYHCADIEEHMIQDNVAAMKQLKEAGFTDVFLDDDLRMGNHGPEITGCFCDACIHAFNVEYHHDETRETLSNRIGAREQGPLVDDWMDAICKQVNRLVEALAISGTNLGIMVMHRGDERHGIRVDDWKLHVPHLRVGEAHFDDRAFEPPRGKASEVAGMQIHVAGMRFATLYSETTAFPARALSAENWTCKAKLAVALGIPNLFLMGGTWLITENYWHALAEVLPGLQAIAKLAGEDSTQRTTPVHVALGRGDFELPWWPLRAGIPAQPVRANDASPGGEVLLVLGSTRLDKQWLDQLRRYKKVLVDATAWDAIPGMLRCHTSIMRLDRGSGWVARLYQAVLPSMRERGLASRLRRELRGMDQHVPFMESGMDIFVAWVKDKGVILACNLRHDENKGTLRQGDHALGIQFAALELIAVKTSDHGLSIEVRV